MCHFDTNSVLNVVAKFAFFCTFCTCACVCEGILHHMTRDALILQKSMSHLDWAKSLECDI